MSSDHDTSRFDAQLDALASAVARGGRYEGVEAVRALLDAGADPSLILDRGIVKGITTVGDQFRDSQCFIPEVLLAARGLRACLDMLRPHLCARQVPVRGTVVLGTVHGDLHDIGKRLVGIMLEGAGFRVIDLGVDVLPQTFAEAARQHGAQIVGVSALLTTTMKNIREVIAELDAGGLRDRVKVIVGGAPVTEQWAMETGADAYAPDAVTAADKCRELVSCVAPA